MKLSDLISIQYSNSADAEINTLKSKKNRFLTSINEGSYIEVFLFNRPVITIIKQKKPFKGLFKGYSKNANVFEIAENDNKRWN